MTEPYYDPYDFEIDADPHRVWRRMARWTTWEIDHEAAEMARTSTVRGWKRLPPRI
jgi:hypothetical protein